MSGFSSSMPLLKEETSKGLETRLKTSSRRLQWFKRITSRRAVQWAIQWATSAARRSNSSKEARLKTSCTRAQPFRDDHNDPKWYKYIQTELQKKFEFSTERRVRHFITVNHFFALITHMWKKDWHRYKHPRTLMQDHALYQLSIYLFSRMGEYIESSMPRGLDPFLKQFFKEGDDDFMYSFGYTIRTLEERISGSSPDSVIKEITCPVVYHYCGSSNPRSLKPLIILRTLIRQLLDTVDFDAVLSQQTGQAFDPRSGFSTLEGRSVLFLFLFLRVKSPFEKRTSKWSMMAKLKKMFNFCEVADLFSTATYKDE